MVSEGNVKYTASHTDTALELPHNVLKQWTELNEARTDLHKLGLIGVYPDGIGYGNLSIRFSAEEFIISGTATGSKAELSLSEYCLVKSFDITRNRVISAGPIQASAESMTHGAVYHSCSAVNCVIHIHSRIIFDGMLRDNYPSTPKDAEFGTPQMAVAIGKLANASEGEIVMAGHDEGVIAYGTSVEKALSKTLELYKKYIGG